MPDKKIKNLKQNSTEAERLLWTYLRNRQFEGVKFRRQHSCPPYILDFYAEEKKLAIEVDGGHHNKPNHKKHDEKRTKDLTHQGIKVIRIWNNDVLTNIEGVLEFLKKEIHPNPSPSHSTNGPLPLPMGEENNDRILVGYIATAHGVKGLLKVKCVVEDETLLNGVLFTSETGHETLTLKLKNPMSKTWIGEAEGVNDRNEAEALRGTKLYIDRSALPDIDDDEIYYFDLIGRAVEDEDGQPIGKIINVDNFGAGDLLDIKPPSGQSFYLPYNDDTVPEVLEDKVIVRIPEGLLS